MSGETLGPLQREITYSAPELRPRNVAKATSDIFDLYFNPNVTDDFNVGGWYLTSHTLKLIDAMRLGLAQNPQIVDRYSMASHEDLERAMSFDRALDIRTDEIREAIDFALVTMAYLPEVVQRWTDIEGNQHFVEFSRIGMFRPPYTLDQTRERLKELWVETTKIATKKTDRLAPIVLDPSKARVVTFFTVASGLGYVNSEEGNRDFKNNFPDYLAQKYNPGE